MDESKARTNVDPDPTRCPTTLALLEMIHPADLNSVEFPLLLVRDRDLDDDVVLLARAGWLDGDGAQVGDVPVCADKEAVQGGVEREVEVGGSFGSVV